MKRMTSEDVIKKAKAQWLALRDDYVKTLEGAAPIKRIMSEDEKNVAFLLYLRGNFGEEFTMDEFIREALKEHAKRSKMSDQELNKIIEMTRKGD